MHPHSLSKHLTSFQVSCYKGKCKQSVFGGILSVSPQSVCSSRHSLSCLIYFILKGLSICITGTGWEKVSDVCRVGFLLLFVIVKINGLLLSGHTPDSPSMTPLGLTCLSLQVSAHQRYELHVPDAFTWETYFVRLWQTFFYYPSNISLFTIWWLGNRTILLSNKINVPATWQNIQHWRGFALVNAHCILWTLRQDTKYAIGSSGWECFMGPAALLLYVTILIIAFSCHLGQLFLLLSAILACK